jgi:hypothetical protein
MRTPAAAAGLAPPTKPKASAATAIAPEARTVMRRSLLREEDFILVFPVAVSFADIDWLVGTEFLPNR